MADRQLEKGTNAGPSGWILAAGFILAVKCSWLLYSRFGVNHSLPMADALDAPRENFENMRTGRLSYYVDRLSVTNPRPLVLVHSVNAAASAYEMAPLFNHYRGKRPVYVLDLPGFGFSERARRVYSPQLYQDAITEFMVEVVKEPADVIALSLGGEFAARAALAHPRLFHSLVILSPTGLSWPGGGSSSQKVRKVGLSNAIHPFLSMRLWARPLFDLIATRSSIEYFLNKSFVGSIPPGMVEYAYISAHQPGAEYAPLYFLSGKLFTSQVRTRVYEQLRIPVLALYDRDPYSHFETLPDLLLKNHHWQAVRLVPSLGLPHWERTADTLEVIEAYWKGLKQK